MRAMPMEGRDGGEPVPDRPRRLVLAAEGLRRGYPRKAVLRGVDLSLEAGEGVLVLGRRGSGKTALARMLAGHAPPDSGRIALSAPVAPIVGQGSGLGITGTLERDLALRAAAYGLESASYVEAVAALLDGEARLDAPFSALDSVNKAAANFGAAYLVPADVYIADGPPVPMPAMPRRRVLPLFERVRRTAAVVWFMATPLHERELRPDRVLLLEGGRLRALSGLDEAEEIFMVGRAHRMRRRRQRAAALAAASDGAE